ncbi:hypothetical protein B1987_24770 [Mycobacterium kansasii]|uniref:Lipoprotein LppU n=1 Tax=Mycobacterium attenuatum TaxID=2341086 RepID=A0A498PWW9_9MYCO|nr:hypothetical protein [Mycobacterium attenuatum]ORB86453.1 hypothetical protein B1987_24770 [Mycobacterium kansasii]VBA37427.1 hypothetical protein LAUMK136_01915 [Mycobacterium attenuatum]VBA50460.1 hypothetical protein LAUMK191_01907 [Mycobacterium attenuatum]VBA56179.1 hypothetical protein LAUMK41_01981 [Mycobacterium attenuatum]
MRTLACVFVAASGIVLGCSSAANVADLKVGDCLRLGGTPDRPQVTKAACGTPDSNFKVIAVVKPGVGRAQCPADIDSSYSMHNSLSGEDSTLCLDIDWVVGGCMSVDPAHKTDPFRVDCNDTSAPHRQRATQILRDLDPPVTADQCVSGVGYTYTQRRFAVCVEDVSNGPRT